MSTTSSIGAWAHWSEPRTENRQLRHLKVLELSRLAAEGLRAQDEIGMFMGELNDQAARFDERREALLARRWTY
jgi:hypothetical protein